MLVGSAQPDQHCWDRRDGCRRPARLLALLFCAILGVKLRRLRSAQRMILGGREQAAHAGAPDRTRPPLSASPPPSRSPCSSSRRTCSDPGSTTAPSTSPPPTTSSPNDSVGAPPSSSRSPASLPASPPAAWHPGRPDGHGQLHPAPHPGRDTASDHHPPRPRPARLARQSHRRPHGHPSSALVRHPVCGHPSRRPHADRRIMGAHTTHPATTIVGAGIAAALVALTPFFSPRPSDPNQGERH